MDMNAIPVDESLSVDEAVKRYKDVNRKHYEILENARAAGRTLSDDEYQATGYEVLTARVNAQFAVKRATGYFPIDLAMMGL